MMDAWERARALAEKHANAGGIFIRLAGDGDKVIGAFCGEPHTREVVWLGDHYEILAPAKHKDKKPSLRVAMNFYVPAEGKMKILEGGVAWFKDVLKVRTKYGLDSWLFEIERHGDAGDPKTRYSLLPEAKIDADLRARMAPIEPHDLASIGVGDDDEGEEPKGSAAAPQKAAAPKPNAEAAGAIVPVEIVREIMTRLKAVPRPEVDVFLKRFGITKIRDIKIADEPAARRFIEDAERRHGVAVAGDGEVDPFG